MKQKNELKDLRKHQKGSVRSPVSDIQKNIKKKIYEFILFFFRLQLHIIIRNDHFLTWKLLVSVATLDEKSTLKDD